MASSLWLFLILGIVIPVADFKDLPINNRGSNELKIEDSTAESEENPCKFKPQKMPDFHAPGRRISKVKCFEYIWDIKAREDRAENEAKCQAYLLERGEQDFYNVTIGGRDTLPGEFPHMGAIGWESSQGGWIFKCGGSLISSKFVLTAAYCSRTTDRDFTVVDVVPKIVRLADKNILETNKYGAKLFHQDSKILRFINHPKYVAPKKYYDIALIELADKVQFTAFIQPACLYTGPDNQLVGQKATTTGWGVVETVTYTTSPELQAGVVDILDSQRCDELLQTHCNWHWCGVGENQICAGNLAGGTDSCEGRPLQVAIQLPQRQSCYDFCRRMHQVIGVMSFGVGCALPNLPGVYTRVSSFLDWIEDVVWKQM